MLPRYLGYQCLRTFRIEGGDRYVGLRVGAYADILFRALSKLVSLKTISGSSTYTEECRLFYGHYDIVTAATGSRTWSDDAYTMSGRNGFYYGRGVSDNKGPVLAAMFAASDLLKEDADVNVTFLIEGEEECGSKGFAESVKTKKVIAC